MKPSPEWFISALFTRTGTTVLAGGCLSYSGNREQKDSGLEFQKLFIEPMKPLWGHVQINQMVQINPSDTQPSETPSKPDLGA